jgi:predicted amidohydrolase
MKIALANIYTRNFDPYYNYERIKNFYKTALEHSVELLIFPHLAINGLEISLDDVENDDYLEKYCEILDKIIDLTSEGKCAVLAGGIFVKGDDDNCVKEYYDSAFFIKNSVLERVISRKTIDKRNPLNDNRVFNKSIFLDAFEYGNKRFNLLISDDLYSNFNILLSGEQKPNYIICLDSSIFDGDFKKKRLIKLSKFANCPVFYLNSANRFNSDIVFNGDVILINEDFRITLDIFYTEDRLIIFDIDNEDGTEILLKKDFNSKEAVWAGKQNLNVIRESSKGARPIFNCNNYSITELKKIQKTIKNCKLVRFFDDGKDYSGIKGITDVEMGEACKNILCNDLTSNKDKRTLMDIIIRAIANG